MLVIQPPNEVFSARNNHSFKMFLAGGITNCPNWQQTLLTRMSREDFPYLTVFNPRREHFDVKDIDAIEQQITWEYNKLRASNLVVFWFAKGSINPIVLYELGMWCNSRPEDHCIVGVDPEYERKQDVLIQTYLARPDLVVAQDFDRFGEAVMMAIRDVFGEDDVQEN